MVVAQKVKESEIIEQDSLLLTRNLLNIAIFNISYIRGLFPEKYFIDESVPPLDMKIKKLMPLDAESRRLIDWMERGVYDALQKKYLKTLLFCVCEAVDGPMLEEYSFSFSYSKSDSQEVSMNINRSGSKKGWKFKYDSTTEITPSQIRSSACKMVRTLVQLMRTVDKMPEERTVLMKLMYYDDVTPMDYEPPFFRGTTEEEAQWNINPLKMEVGKINSKHLVLALKVKSVLDPREDENNDTQDDEVSLGADSLQKDEDIDTDSEITNPDEDQYIVAPIGKPQVQEDTGAIDEGSFVGFRFALTRYLLHILIEEIMDKLVKENFISKAGDDSYVLESNKMGVYGGTLSVLVNTESVQFGSEGYLWENDNIIGTKGVKVFKLRYNGIIAMYNGFDYLAKEIMRKLRKMDRTTYLDSGLCATVANSHLKDRSLKDIWMEENWDVAENFDFEKLGNAAMYFASYNGNEENAKVLPA